jgi:hypothetical protein
MQAQAATTLTKSLMRKYLPKYSMFEAAENWTLVLGHSRKYIARCVFHSRIIVLSPQMCQQSADEVIRDAVLHEISRVLKAKERFRHI